MMLIPLRTGTDKIFRIGAFNLCSGVTLAGLPSCVEKGPQQLRHGRLDWGSMFCLNLHRGYIVVLL